MECPFCGGDIDFHDSFDLENCLIKAIQENENLKNEISTLIKACNYLKSDFEKLKVENEKLEEDNYDLRIESGNI